MAKNVLFNAAETPMERGQKWRTRELSRNKTIVLAAGVVAAIVLAILALLLRGGPQGLQGVQGLQGPKGEQGPKGDNGATGPQGPHGENGTIGAQGPQGSPGKNGLPGENGLRGENGSKWYTGEGIPSNSLGANGDFYLENLSDNFYLKIDDIWVYENISLKGLQGLRGEQGPQGPQGSPGENGKDANVEADVKGLLQYSVKIDPPSNCCCIKYIQTVSGFLVNFGTENAENVVIHITLENVSDSVLFKDNIFVGELKGHGLCAINCAKYVENARICSFTYEITWS